jgi:predicted DNA-binding transcriptional regulator YafY
MPGEKYKSCEIDWEDYFYDIVGVTRYENRTPMNVDLKVSSERAPYIKTKPIHPTMKIKRNDQNGMLITINVIPNPELEAQILLFGEDIEVIEPQYLRAKIQNRLEKSLRHYEQ